MFAVAHCANPCFITNVSFLVQVLFSKHNFNVNVQNAKHFSTVTDLILNLAHVDRLNFRLSVFTAGMDLLRFVQVCA